MRSFPGRLSHVLIQDATQRSPPHLGGLYSPNLAEGYFPEVGLPIYGFSEELGAAGRAQLFEQVSLIQLLNRRSLSKSGFVVPTNGLLQLGEVGGV